MQTVTRIVVPVEVNKTLIGMMVVSLVVEVEDVVAVVVGVRANLALDENGYAALVKKRVHHRVITVSAVVA